MKFTRMDSDAGTFSGLRNTETYMIQGPLLQMTHAIHTSHPGWTKKERGASEGNTVFVRHNVIPVRVGQYVRNVRNWPTRLCLFFTMDKTKTRLAAFFDNDEDDSSFPVRRIELLFPFILAHLYFMQ